MQIMEGDLARTVEANLAVINHVQLADNPGRNEPGTGEINYRFLLSTWIALVTRAGLAVNTSQPPPPLPAWLDESAQRHLIGGSLMAKIGFIGTGHHG